MHLYFSFEQIFGVVFAAAYMVAKGSDLVQTAMFVKRAFIELLKKVVRVHRSHTHTSTTIVFCSFFFFRDRVSVQRQRKSNYNTPVHNVPSVTTISRHRCYWNAAIFSVNCVWAIGSIESRRVRCAVPKLPTIRRGEMVPQLCSINSTETLSSKISKFSNFFLILFLFR